VIARGSHAVARRNRFVVNTAEEHGAERVQQQVGEMVATGFMPQRRSSGPKLSHVTECRDP
jgi:hypothetical protein